MTKEEIRSLTLCKLRPESHHRVLDIGAGTGSLSVECGLLLSGGLVYAVEKKKEAVELIAANVKLFHLKNVRIIEGEAPGALEGIGAVDRVLVGGSGGKLAAILKDVQKLLVAGGRLVQNCFLLETMAESLYVLEGLGFQEISCLLVSISRSRKLGAGTALQPLNPVYIISAVNGEGEQGD